MTSLPWHDGKPRTCSDGCGRQLVFRDFDAKTRRLIAKLAIEKNWGIGAWYFPEVCSACKASKRQCG